LQLSTHEKQMRFKLLQLCWTKLIYFSGYGISNRSLFIYKTNASLVDKFTLDSSICEILHNTNYNVGTSLNKLHAQCNLNIMRIYNMKRKLVLTGTHYIQKWMKCISCLINLRVLHYNTKLKKSVGSDLFFFLNDLS
jgi:hypothetical protein